MKRIFFALIIFFIAATCKTGEYKEVDSKTAATIYEENKMSSGYGFRYEVPSHMEKEPEPQYYRYDDLLLEKGKNIFDSSIIIAIRKTKDYNQASVLSFARQDQGIMRQSVRNVYYESDWDPPSLNEKGIDHVSFEFSYDYDKKKIYQRSVYIKYCDAFYIVSQSSLKKDELYKEKNIMFWNSISVD